MLRPRRRGRDGSWGSPQMQVLLEAFSAWFALDHATADVLVDLAAHHRRCDARWLLDHPLRNTDASPEPIPLAGYPFHRGAVLTRKRKGHCAHRKHAKQD